ncbi:MAG: hypothetical protein DRP09_18705 [Candidatus Thorarchaeota archaeon]|nr:MAG: hypothetical protein DRP09_18705 [Candidatus Thorarchaeota archaeon]
MFDQSKIWHWIRTVITEALVVAAIYFLVKHLAGNWNQIAPDLRHIRLGYVVAACLPTLVMLLLVSWGWTIAMRWVGVPLSARTGFEIYYRSSIFRYLPGSFWYLPGRAYLCRQLGVPLTTFAGSAFLELFFLLSAAGILGGIAVTVRFNLIWLSIISLGCLLSIALALFWPKQLRRLALREHNASQGQRAKLVAIIVIYLCAWLMYGTSLSLLLLALNVPVNLSIGNYGYIVSASTAAWIAGFLSFIPTGLGVREASLAGLLQPIAGAEQIVLLSLFQRTIEILLEGCLWIIALLIKNGQEPKIVPK